jgi:antitoxin (DNA-binding transcriptional repressor) of toxin-antitoxin stability system
MPIREFHADVANMIARVEAGETIDLTRDGKVVARLQPPAHSDEASNQRSLQQSWQAYVDGFGIAGLSGPASYDERTGR